MSALEQKVNPGPSAFPDLERKHQVPGAQFAIYHGGSIVAHEIGELEFGNPHGTMPPRRQVATGQEPVPAFAPADALAVSAVDLVKLGLIHVRPG